MPAVGAARAAARITRTLACWDCRESWVRPMDGKASGEIDAAIVMLQATDLGLGSIWVMTCLSRSFRL